MVFKSFYYKILSKNKKTENMDFDIEENIFYDEVMNKLLSIEDALYLAKDGTEDKEIINEIFRSFHTVKGVSDLLGFIDVVKLTHKAEDLLDEIRNNNIRFGPRIYFTLMELKGFISTLVTDSLRGREMSIEKRELFDSFIEEIDSHLSHTILLLENDPEKISFLNELPEKSKFTLISKTDHEKIFNLLGINNVKLIFCDIEEDEESTIELINTIKQNSRYKKVPIVLSVSKVDENLKTTGKRTGATAWIKKPYDKEKFRSLVKQLLGQ